MTIQQNFSSSRGFPAPPVNLGLSASGNFYDMKNFIEFSTDIFVPQTGDTTITKFHFDIDLASASSGDNKTFNITNKIFSSEVTKNKFVHNISIGVANDYSHDYIFAFQNGIEYKILYEIYINHKPSGSSITTTYKLSHIQYFRYFATPVIISNFSFNDNVQVGDDIEVSGLNLIHVLRDASNNPIDTTVPENRVNVAAIQFRFQEVDIPVLNNNGVRVNDEPAEYYTVDMSYNPLGNYTLKNNTLTTGKIYKVDADAYWALGYFTSERSSQHLYVLSRPVITQVKVENLASAAITDANVVTITTEPLLNAGDTVSPSKIWFEFYNNSNVLVARAGDGNPNVGAISTILAGHGAPIVQNNTYSFSLSKINRITTQGIIIGDIHTVKAIVLLPGEPGYENVKQLRISQPVSVTFVNVKPLIASITPYDVQNDGGNDGIFHPNSTDVDSPNQIVATVAVSNAAYKLYPPSHIKFNIYNSAGTTKLAETSDYVFSNSLSTDVNGNVIGNFLYNILLNEVTLLGGAELLTNGTYYKVKAQVKLSDHNSDIELRESQEFTNVTFSQNVAPVPSVNITNTYLLNTNSDPSSFSAKFTASPLIGISGYFMKTAQFGSVYSKQLDVATTKFRIEYKLNGSANWVPANRVALGQRTSGETRTDAAARIGSVDNESYIVTTTDGQYANIIGTGLGTSQGEMIFYIPQNQGAGNSTAFTESNTVSVRVTVVVTTGLWAPGQSTSTPTLATPDPLQIIKKISEYDSTGTSEPWNIEKDNSLLYVHLNGEIVEVNKSVFKQYSNTIITELDQGWRIINTGVGTNGAQEGNLPKVDLSYYKNKVPAAEQTSSNSSRVSQINGMGAYVVINQNQNAIKYPFIVVYTTSTVTSANKSELYKSKLLYSSSVSGNTTDSTRVGLTLLYTGTDNPLFRPDIPSNRRVKMDFSVTSSDTFGNYATEFVNYVSVETSSGASTHQAGDFNFTLSEAGLTTSLSFLSSLVMSFTKNLFLNIPVKLSLSGESVKIGYKYNPSHSYIYRTFTFPSTVVSLLVDPNQGTTLYYSTSYIVEGTQGLTIEVNVPNKYFPLSSDYTIANSAYNTFNTSGTSKISFALTLAADSKNRLDGVNVYFTSPTGSTGSTGNLYVINGSNNPTLSFVRGQRYTINVNSPGHPFWIQTVPGAYSSANIYNTGVTGNGTENGIITINVALDAPTLYYVCQNHASMNGTINVSNSPSPTHFNVTASSGLYVINGSNNPTLSFVRGQRYTINVNSPGHPFWIQTVPGAYSSANIYNTGVTGNGTESGTITIDVALDAPTLYYVCQHHASMNGTINVSNSPSPTPFNVTVPNGVNVANGSGINKVRIGSYVSGGSKMITLLDATGGFLKVINASGSIINSASVWGNYDLANISFVAFRDARVNNSNATYSSTSNVSDPILSNFYVETGSQSTFGSPTNRNPVWNVPVLTRPASDTLGTNKYVLSGGVINTTNGSIYHYIRWPTASDANSVPFTYDLKLSKNILTTSVIDTQQNLAVNTHILPIDLTTIAEYTIEITKVFNGNTNQRELSPIDSIVFSSIEVLTNNMNVEVKNPSNTSSVTIASIAVGIASFDDNIYAHHIQYRTNPSNGFVKLDSNIGLIENPEPAPDRQKLYTLPVQTLGTVYEFVMYVEAQVKFKINNIFSSDKSLPLPVPLTPVTQQSKYRVSTIPSIILPHTTPVLVQGSSDPTLLLNLNAKGLENEGFVSVVVILTQDGTSAKPEGEQALLIFPDPNSNHPFTFLNTLPLTGGAGAGDVRLAGGDSAVSAPKNVAPSVLSTQNNNYTLTIGTAGSDGRYGLSTLKMPTSANSGFIDSVPINYMVILTTRRGTDIAVGDFTYMSLPAVQNVSINTSVVNGETQYTVNFNINSS